MRYDFAAIEARWQRAWSDRRTFASPNPGEAGFHSDRPKCYVLDMFPYPSGVGLHVGHPLGYIATDIVARYRRMRGDNVLHPMGYDAFGLPAEQFAVEHGVHPRTTTEANIANMTRQLKSLGLSYDWDRSLATTDPGYYKWTQWIFLQLFGSWFDPTANKARPIAELEQLLASERAHVGIDGEVVFSVGEGLDPILGQAIGTLKWVELTPAERRAVLDGYRLAYLDEVPVNWCPALGTVLANEEVTSEGRSERGNHPVYRRPLKQWMLRITAYADRLADELDGVDWPESTKLLQKNWIGRSEGARVDFPLAFDATHQKPVEGETITVFTTRPDTLFGATYMVLAPEHPLVDLITTAPQFESINAYRNQAAGKSDLERQAEAAGGTKTGVFTGAYALNPVNNLRIPIWIADYVMMGYGTGAIMAVPAHDERDFAFAKTFGLPIRAVVMPDLAWLHRHGPVGVTGARKTEPGADVSGTLGRADHAAGDQRLVDAYLADAGPFTAAFVGTGRNINSASEAISLDSLDTPDAKRRMIDWLTHENLGSPQVQYKLRDWLFSRQRYWGEPFPILHGPEGEIIPVPESELPVSLPAMDDFRPAASDDPQAPPQPPLARAGNDWKYVERDGVVYTREFNTMPQWAGSCWYYLRFLDPHNADRFVSREAEKYWMTPRPSDGAKHAGPPGVDLYVGGVEHAVLHLLYARFWHKVLFDLGHVSTPEPFGRLFNQGYIQAFAYVNERGMHVSAEEVVDQDGRPAMEVQDQKGRRFFHAGQPVTQQYGKMGKSLKNAVAPDEMCTQYGADSLRLYEMYLGPLDQSKPWRTQDIVGVHRFLQRLWRTMMDENTSELRVAETPASPELRRLLHKTIKRVTEAMDQMAYNVAIAALIELNNDLVKRFGSDEARRVPAPGSTGSTAPEPGTGHATGSPGSVAAFGTGHATAIPTTGPASLPVRSTAATPGGAGRQAESGVTGGVSGGVTGGVPREVAETMLLLLSPMAPHIAEELWSHLGHDQYLAREPWPSYDPAQLIEATLEYPVQVNGKLRSKITVPADAGQTLVEKTALEDPKVQAAMAGKPVRKLIVVPKKLVNIVV